MISHREPAEGEQNDGEERLWGGCVVVLIVVWMPVVLARCRCLSGPSSHRSGHEARRLVETGTTELGCFRIHHQCRQCSANTPVAPPAPRAESFHSAFQLVCARKRGIAISVTLSYSPFQSPSLLESRSGFVASPHRSTGLWTAQPTASQTQDHPSEERSALKARKLEVLE